jgi:hypothetical protein
MPVTLNQIAANTASITLSVGGETVTIEYFPGRVTEKVLTAGNFSRRGDKPEDIAAGVEDFNGTLANLIKSWDVLENDGQTMFPIEAGRFPDLPLGFRLQVFSDILGAFRPEAIAPQVA